MTAAAASVALASLVALIANVAAAQVVPYGSVTPGASLGPPPQVTGNSLGPYIGSDGTVILPVSASSSATTTQSVATSAASTTGNASGTPVMTGAASSTSSTAASSTATSAAAAQAAAEAILAQAPAAEPVIAAPSPAAAPQVVEIGTDGSVLLRGTAQVMTGTTTAQGTALLISSWGGLWTVRVSSATDVAAGPADSIASISPGDFVGVIGTISASDDWTIDATVVRDWTTTPIGASAATSSASGATGTQPYGSGIVGDAVSSAPASSSATSTHSGQQAAETLYTGTVSDASTLGSGSIILAGDDGATYTVSFADGAAIWDNTRTDMPASNIAEGDTIRLNGTIQPDGTIMADVVRDMSR